MKIIATDFDGTLTTRDTLVEFIRFAKGDWRTFFGFALHLPWILLMKMRLYPNWKSKQRLFSYFFRGMPRAEFQRLGRDFANRVESFRREEVIDRVKALGEDHARVYVVSASIEDWVRPWCERQGFLCIGTQVEADADGLLTGHFASPNCYGSEKKRRLLEKEPCRESYTLYAFGDSKGDEALLAFADYPFWVGKKSLLPEPSPRGGNK